MDGWIMDMDGPMRKNPESIYLFVSALPACLTCDRAVVVACCCSSIGMAPAVSIYQVSYNTTCTSYR